MASPRRHYDLLTLSALHDLSHDRSHALKGIHPATLRHYLTTLHADSLGVRWVVSVARQLRQLETKGEVLVFGSGPGKRYRLSPSTRRHLNRSPLKITTSPAKISSTAKRTPAPTTPRRTVPSPPNSTALKNTTKRVHRLEQQRREAAARARDSARELSLLREEHTTLLARLADRTPPTAPHTPEADTGLEDSALDCEFNPPTLLPPAACGVCADAEVRVVEARGEAERVGAELHVAVARAHTAEERLTACQAELEGTRTALAQTQARVEAVVAERDILEGRLRDVSKQLDDVTNREAAQRLAADAARAHVVGVLGLFGRLQDAANLLGGTPLAPSNFAQAPIPMEIQVEVPAAAGDDEGRPPSPGSFLLCRSQSEFSDCPVPFLSRKSTEVILGHE